jgi:hypothetical protein
LQTSSPDLLWDVIASEAAAESALWQKALRPPATRQLDCVFSPLAESRFRLGLETIYEGYLVHYGRPRLFDPNDRDTALLLGDYLYAHGVQRIASLEEARAVLELGELISVCAQLRGDREEGDGAAWAATAALLGEGLLEEPYAALREDHDPRPLLAAAEAAAGAEAVERALASHARYVG